MRNIFVSFQAVRSVDRSTHPALLIAPCIALISCMRAAVNSSARIAPAILGASLAIILDVSITKAERPIVLFFLYIYLASLYTHWEYEFSVHYCFSLTIGRLVASL